MKKFILSVTILLIFAGIAFATNFVKQNKVIFENRCDCDSTLQRKCNNNFQIYQYISLQFNKRPFRF
jgi:hypothetical protein